MTNESLDTAMFLFRLCVCVCVFPTEICRCATCVAFCMHIDICMILPCAHVHVCICARVCAHACLCVTDPGERCRTVFIGDTKVVKNPA